GLGLTVRRSCMLIGGRTLMTISAACAAPIPTAIPMSVVKSSFRIVFSRGYLSKCVAVTDFPFFPQKTGTTHYRTVDPGFIRAMGIPVAAPVNGDGRRHPGSRRPSCGQL